MMLVLNGADGEGGGQILRTALSLAMITRTPFRIDNIRAKRKKPGLLRQHLACVRASVEISGAKATGAELGSQKLVFEPGEVRAGQYRFAIGSAGSTSLVFQTVLPALLVAKDESRVVFEGGTHNPSAPTFDYIKNVFLPVLGRMGAEVNVALHRPGFFPAGGGKWHAIIKPHDGLVPLTLDEAGPLVSKRVIATVANLSLGIAEREANKAAALLGWEQALTETRSVDADGTGNVLAVELAYEHVTEMVTGFGSIGMSAEAVAADVVQEVCDFLSVSAPVGPHLADQLLLPMALAKGGAFTTSSPTLHTRTSIAVIETFLPVEFTVAELGNGRWRISVTA